MTVHWPESWQWTLYGAPAYDSPKDGSGGLVISQLKERTHPTLVFYKINTIACMKDDVETDRFIQADEFFINRYQAIAMDSHDLKTQTFKEIDELMASYGLVPNQEKVQ